MPYDIIFFVSVKSATYSHLLFHYLNLKKGASYLVELVDQGY